MRRHSTTLVALLAASLLTACWHRPSNVTLEKSKGNTPIAKVPDWYLKPPTSSSALFAAATSSSRDLDIAIAKARTEARQQLAEQVATRVDGITKQLAVEVAEASGAPASADAGTLRQEFSRLSTQSTALTLYGVRPRDQVVRIEGQLYRAFVLLELPLESISRSLVTEAQTRPELSERLRKSTTYRALEREAAASSTGATTASPQLP